MPQRYADLEIGLRWVAEEQGLDIGLRFMMSDQNIDNWIHLTELLRLDLPLLARKANDPDAYAQALTGMVFSRHDIADFVTSSLAQAGGVPVHLRLNLEAPPALHRVRWELLRGPRDEQPIATTERLLLSRYLSSPDFRAVAWRTKRASRALVVIAAPSDIARFSAGGGVPLAPVDVAAEMDNARHALQGIDTVFLAGDGKATLAGLARELCGQVDILYLVCHGVLDADVPTIFLEKADGTADPVDGRRLQETIFSLPRRPTLALLNSCQSAGPGGAAATVDDGTLAGLGPRLAAAGIAAVIAMQGNVTLTSARMFAARLFDELQQDGVVDRAVAAARRLLRENDRSDWWVPVLFSRLRSGRTYFRAGFTEKHEGTWDKLASLQRTGRFTPVLGPGMTDGILGSRQEIAERWATRWQMPVMAHNRTDLAKVAQYLLVEQKSPAAVANLVAEYLQEEIAERIERAKDQPDDPFHDVHTDEPQPAILQAGRRMLSDPGDAFRTVAAMPVPLFVTTNWTPLLEQALAEHDPPKKPTTAYFRWNKRGNWPAQRTLPPPTPESPLVYHLFGRMEDPDSLVLSEDDYFEWLRAWVSQRDDRVPEVVKKQLTNRSLLFLGYHLDDSEFRVVFQSIKTFLGSEQLLPNNVHVGVQFSPSTHDVEPEAAQDYLESYFDSNNVGIFWSATRAFLDSYRERTGMRT